MGLRSDAPWRRALSVRCPPLRSPILVPSSPPLPLRPDHLPEAPPPQLFPRGLGLRHRDLGTRLSPRQPRRDCGPVSLLRGGASLRLVPRDGEARSVCGTGCRGRTWAPRPALGSPRPPAPVRPSSELELRTGSSGGQIGQEGLWSGEPFRLWSPLPRGRQNPRPVVGPGVKQRHDARSRAGGWGPGARFHSRSGDWLGGTVGSVLGPREELVAGIRIPKSSG